ncbi:16S rRNA (uracil(1498)-N(3))-methyltransferase [Kaarinaea lacus]
MRIPRIYQATPLKTGESILLDAQAATHVARVLRLKQHDQIIVFNGQGGEYTGVIEAIDKRSVKIVLQDYHQPLTESPLHISLLQGISRSERMDYTLQKSVELGVSELYPVTTQHISIHLDETRARKKHAHWQGVVNSACEQSGRNLVPRVHELTSLQDCVEQISTVAEQTMLVLDHRANTTMNSVNITENKHITIVVGPEGGLSDDEREWLVGKGFIGVSMGPRVLRTETAALAAIAVMQSLWGDFSYA